MMSLEYADGEKLFIPFGDTNKLHKYLGFEKRLPRLHTIGSKLWKAAKERAKKGVLKMAVDLLELQAKRAAVGGFRFSADTEWQKALEGQFPYKETADQLTAMAEVKSDKSSTW